LNAGQVNEGKKGKVKGQNLLSVYIEHNHAEGWNLEQHKKVEVKLSPLKAVEAY
jgi:hypothetical protein